ncbi:MULTISPECIES: heavy metal transporter [Streptomyces]|uniref:heavy metal transporter n=1 Tax=Streptomyces TaxID=1883 RepID=UPI001CCEACCB|nr:MULTISPECIES: heavy metal transporter [Streptomyces]MCM8555799.1 heavy metal transporter [Streptomyces sp. STCH 565 A]
MLPPSPPPRRRGRLLRAGAASVVLLALAGYVTAQYVTGGPGDPKCTVVSGKGDGASYEFTPEQAVNAATITAVATARELPERAAAIALTTALQESALRNLDHGDKDSLGLFQQRPMWGWGTPAQIMDPAYSTGQFFDHLVKVPDYLDLSLNDAAQRVQRSGHPYAYAKHEADALLLAGALTGRSAATLTCDGPPETNRVKGPDAVRAALVRDFGPAVLQPAAAEVADASAAPAESPSPTADAPGAGGGSDERTVTLPVTADSGSSPEERTRRGWQLAHWAVANASALRIQNVSYAGRVWTAGNTDSKWRPTGTGGAKGAERAGGSVRITTAR